MSTLYTTATRRATWGALVGLAVSAAVIATPSRASAQLDYTRTTFYHGFASSDSTWRRWYGDLGGVSPIAYLQARGIDLGGIDTPRFAETTRYADQLAIASDSIYYPNGRNVLVGHSQGGLVARGVYLGLDGVPAARAADVRSGVRAIITVASPHQGALLASTAGEARSFFLDVQRRVNDGLRAASVPVTVATTFIGALVSGGVGAVAGAITGGGSGAAAGAAEGAIAGGAFGALAAGLFVTTQLAGRQIDISSVAAFPTIPALRDLRDTAQAIRDLNASTADAVLPRANIVGRVPYKNAAIRLSANFQGKAEQGQISELQNAKFLFKVCKYTGYATLILSRQARRCGFAIRVLDRVDDSWARFTAGTVNGSGRDVPSDGVVPNERSNYPGLSGLTNLPVVEGATHVSIYRVRPGVDRIEQAMRLIRMEGAQPAPPRRADPPAALQATVSGTTSLTVGEGGYWTAEASGGAPPYAYVWGGGVSGTGPELWWTFDQQGSQYVAVTVTDATGATANAGMSVFVGSGCGTQIVCGMSAPGGGQVAPARAAAARLGGSGSTARAAQRGVPLPH